MVVEVAVSIARLRHHCIHEPAGDLLLQEPDPGAVLTDETVGNLSKRAFEVALRFEFNRSAVGTLGQVVGAAVVLGEGTATDERALQAHVRSQLAQFKVPSRIVQCDELPRGPGGKQQRLIAAARLGLAAAQPQIESPVTETLTSERSVLVSALAALWCDHLALDSIGDDDNFIMMGGDSLRAARLCADAEDVFGVRLPPGIIFGEGATLHGMARVIAAQRNRPRN